MEVHRSLKMAWKAFNQKISISHGNKRFSVVTMEINVLQTTCKIIFSLVSIHIYMLIKIFLKFAI